MSGFDKYRTWGRYTVREDFPSDQDHCRPILAKRWLVALHVPQITLPGPSYSPT